MPFKPSNLETLKRNVMAAIALLLFIPETNHWILLGSAVRGHDPEHDAHGERDTEGNEHRDVRDDGLDAGELLDADTEAAADEDARHASRDADQDRLAEELVQDVLLRGAERAPHADLLDALQHRREHDVHDPDAADDQRDRRDGAEHDVEDRLGALLLLQQQLGYGDLEVDLVVVPSLHHPAQHLRDRRHLTRVRDAHDDLVELVAVQLLGARRFILLRRVRRLDDDGTRRELDVALRDLGAVAISGERGADRDVDVHVGVADAEPLRRLLAHLAVVQDADHGEPRLADLDPAADRILRREEPRAHAAADDGHGAAVVDLCVREPGTAEQRQVVQAEIGRVDADELPGAAVSLAGDHRVQHDLAARRLHAGDHASDCFRVLVGETRREFLDLLLVLVVLRRPLLLLDQRGDDDVVGAQQAHLLEDLLLGTLADGEHRDDGCDAEEDAQRGEAGAQLVVADGIDGDAHTEQDVRDELPAQLREPFTCEPHQQPTAAPRASWSPGPSPPPPLQPQSTPPLQPPS